TIEVGDAYSDLSARIVAPESDLNLGIVIVLDGATTTAISIDTSAPGEHSTPSLRLPPTSPAALCAPSSSPLPNKRPRQNQRTTTPSTRRPPTTMLPRQQRSILPLDRAMTIEADDRAFHLRSTEQGQEKRTKPVR
ncbi:MAG: hypothetical protein ACXW3Y_14535, partial [Rhodoplanes sp.]